MGAGLREDRSSSKTAFSPGAPLSMDSVISRVVRVAAGPFAPGHIGELTRIVPFEMVDAVLAQTRARQRRVRDLPSRVVVYLLLAAGLFADLGYGQVWTRMIAGLGGLSVAVPTAGALAQARRRVGVAPLRALFDLLRGPAAGVSVAGRALAGAGGDRDRWHHPRVPGHPGQPGGLLPG